MRKSHIFSFMTGALCLFFMSVSAYAAGMEYYKPVSPWTYEYSQNAKGCHFIKKYDGGAEFHLRFERMSDLKNGQQMALIGKFRNTSFDPGKEYSIDLFVDAQFSASQRIIARKEHSVEIQIDKAEQFIEAFHMARELSLGIAENIHIFKLDNDDYFMKMARRCLDQQPTFASSKSDMVSDDRESTGREEESKNNHTSLVEEGGGKSGASQRATTELNYNDLFVPPMIVDDAGLLPKEAAMERIKSGIVEQTIDTANAESDTAGAGSITSGKTTFEEEDQHNKSRKSSNIPTPEAKAPRPRMAGAVPKPGMKPDAVGELFEAQKSENLQKVTSKDLATQLITRKADRIHDSETVPGDGGASGSSEEMDKAKTADHQQSEYGAHSAFDKSYKNRTRQGESAKRHASAVAKEVSSGAKDIESAKAEDLIDRSGLVKQRKRPHKINGTVVPLRKPPQGLIENEIIKISEASCEDLPEAVKPLKSYTSQNRNYDESQQVIESLQKQIMLLEREKEALRARLAEQPGAVSLVRSCQKERTRIQKLSEQLRKLETENFEMSQKRSLAQDIDPMGVESDVVGDEELQEEIKRLKAQNETLNKRIEDLEQQIRDGEGAKKDLDENSGISADPALEVQTNDNARESQNPDPFRLDN